MFGVHIQTKHIYLILTIVMGLFFPFFTCSAGIYYLAFFDTFVTDINLPLGAFIELYVFVYVFDFESLEKEVQKHVGCETPGMIKWALKSRLLIVILAGVLLLGLINQIVLYSKYTAGKYILGWVITLYPSLMAIIYWRVYRSDYYRVTFAEIEQYEQNK